MATTPTANAVPSNDVSDLLFNAEKLDEVVNSSELEYTDRFGVQRFTVAGAVDGIRAFNSRGAWATATAYAAKDLVQVSGTWYVCVSAHTSGATFAGDAVRWRVYQGVTSADLADVTTAAYGDSMIGWGSITTTVAGVRTRYASLAAAVTALGSTKTTIVVRGAVTVAVDTTIPSTANLHIVDDGLISISGGITLTINGAMNCPPVQCFTGAGSANFGARVRSVWPEWFGSVGDGDGNGGGTNNYTAINKAISSITATTRRAVIRFVDGLIYRCDTGLSLDVSLHSLKSVGAMLDFYNMGVGDRALTLNATADLAGAGSFYAVTNAVDGLIFKGREGAAPTSPPTVTRNGIYIVGTLSGVVTGYEFRNCIFRNFTNAIALATTANAQAITFTNCNYLWNTTNVLVPLAVSGAAGSKMLFQGGFMTGGVNGFDLRSTVADVTVAGMNVEAMTDNFFYHLGGILNLRNLHVETGTDVGAYVIRQQSGQAGYASVLSTLSVTDCDFIIKSPSGGSTPKTVAAFDFSKLCSNTFIGGSIVTDSATYTTSIFDSDASGEGIGSLTIIGTRLQKTSATVAGTYPSTGIASTIDVNDQWGYVAARAATDYTCLNKFELTATATNLSLGGVGTPTYTITGTRFKNRVEITLRVNANGGTTAATAGSTYFAATGLPTPSGNSSGSVVTTTGLSAGTCLIGPGGGGRIYVGTSWASDSVDRVFSVSYSI